MTEIHMWTFDPALTAPSLLDWIEVNGVPVEEGAAAGELRPPAVIPMGVPGDGAAVRETSSKVVDEGRRLIPTRGGR